MMRRISLVGATSVWAWLAAVGCSVATDADPEPTPNPDDPSCACYIPNAEALCEDDGCVFAACLEGWGDCDGDLENGCEAPLDTVDDCGACGAACGGGGATWTCEAAACVPSCGLNLGNCDGDDANGCEADLTGDDQNCGGCGIDCDGGPCEAGTCGPTVLAYEPPESSSTAYPRSLVLDDSHVYYVGLGTLKRVPKSGQGASELLVGDVGVGDLGVDASGLYFPNEGSVNGVRWSALAPGGGEHLVAEAPSGIFVSNLYVDDSQLYFTNFMQGDILVSPKASGSTATVLFETSIGVRNVVRCGDYLYWTASPRIERGLLGATDTQGFEVVADGQSFPFAIACDDTHVYWTNRDGDGEGIMRASLKDLEVETWLVSPNRPVEVAVDETHVYFTSAEDKSVLRAPKANPNAVETLVSGLGRPSEMAIDGTHVFLNDSGRGEIIRFPKEGF